MILFRRKNIKIFLNYFLGPLLFLALSYSIYRQIIDQADLAQAWNRIRQSLNSDVIWNFLGVFLFMIINWGIEAVKWKLSVRKIQQVSFSRAFKAVLSGVSFSVGTPNRMGEYLFCKGASTILKTLFRNHDRICDNYKRTFTFLLMGKINCRSNDNRDMAGIKIKRRIRCERHSYEERSPDREVKEEE